MDSKTRLQVIIALVFLMVVFVIKKIWLDKKYNAKKSEVIFNTISAILVPYFLVLNQMVLAVIVLIMLAWQSFLHRTKKE